MNKIRIGLNGFGRIGRCFTRITTERKNLEIVAINTRSSTPDILSYLLKYDSVYRTYDREISHDAQSISIDGRNIPTTNIAAPKNIPWEKHDVDMVLDACGAFRTKKDLANHIGGSVKKVIVSAPSKDDETDHVVLGVNDHDFDFSACDILSNASCTTNGCAPLFKILHDNFIIKSGFVNTTHAYTASQNLLDNAAKKFEQARAGAINLVPYPTGAAKAVARCIPDLEGKLDGIAVRVPVPTVSLVDVTVSVLTPTTAEQVNNAFKKAAAGMQKGIIKYETEPLVSSDYIGSEYSTIFASNQTKVMNKNLIKVFGWYDNEWGYSTRLADLAERMAEGL